VTNNERDCGSGNCSKTQYNEFKGNIVTFEALYYYNHIATDEIQQGAEQFRKLKYLESVSKHNG